MPPVAFDFDDRLPDEPAPTVEFRSGYGEDGDRHELRRWRGPES